MMSHANFVQYRYRFVELLTLSFWYVACCETFLFRACSHHRTNTFWWLSGITASREECDLRCKRMANAGELICILSVVYCVGVTTSNANTPMWKPVPIPSQVPVTEGLADLPAAKLWYWDTNGDGPAVVLMHAGSGSGTFWPYQQPVLANAGFRVIGYSRRGYTGSETGNVSNPGTGSGDLHNLADYLGLGKFHLVGLAAGGIVSMDYALSHPERLLSLTIASSIMGVTDPDYVRLSGILRPPVFGTLPHYFQELSPSYRAGNLEGADAWKALQKASIPGVSVNQNVANRITWAAVETIKVPTLLLTGDSDLYTPPSMLRLQAGHMSHAETYIVKEAGHAPNWEQPEDFNQVLTQFLRRVSP